MMVEELFLQATFPEVLIRPTYSVKPSVPLSACRPPLWVGPDRFSPRFVPAVVLTLLGVYHHNRRRLRCHLTRHRWEFGSGIALKAVAASERLFLAQDGSGARLELVGGSGVGEANTSSRAPTLLLVHGSYHAAWCWEKHFIGFFQKNGFDTYAVSLRGQGRGSVPGKPPAVAGTLEMHAADVAALVDHLHEENGQPVVVLGHSFGGLIVQRAVADLSGRGTSALGGMVLLSSVPPSGNGGLVWRYLLRDPWLAARITWGFATRAFERDVALCRDLFFDDDMPATVVEDHMRQMKESSPPGTRLLDLRELQRSLPCLVPTPGQVPTLVLAGDLDTIVDAEALAETAEAHKVSPVILEGLPHDAMLSTQWSRAADVVLQWLEGLEFGST